MTDDIKSTMFDKIKNMTTKSDIEGKASAGLTVDDALIDDGADELAESGVELDVKEEPVNLRKVFKKVVVHRIGRNSKTLISINDGYDPNGFIEFWPGQTVTLTMVQINILKDACLRHKIQVPQESGINLSMNPKVEIAQHYPGMEGKKIGNTWYACKREPRFAIENAE